MDHKFKTFKKGDLVKHKDMLPTNFIVNEVDYIYNCDGVITEEIYALSINNKYVFHARGDQLMRNKYEP